MERDEREKTPMRFRVNCVRCPQFARWRVGGGLSGVLRDEIAVDVEHVTSVGQVHDMRLVVLC